MDSDKKQIYGLIGYPVKHSFSAAMHNAAFSHLGINAEYRLFEVKPLELKYFFHRIIPLKDINGEEFAYEDLHGFNVTIPHKVAALEFLNEKSSAVADIEAVNTVSVHELCSVFKGYNTDFSGFERHISELDVNTEKVAIIGAGGAARAVAYALRTKAKEIVIYDIDRHKAHSLSHAINSWDAGCAAYAVDSLERLNLADKRLLVNATPLGMKQDDPLLVTKQMLHSDLFVYDLVYNPEVTKLLALAQDNGLRSRNGLKMLLYQGVLAFEHWLGIDAPQEVMFEALQKEIKKGLT